MWCLLLVVKWFTKCLFHGWLLKICFGLSLLLFFSAHVMFHKCPNLHPSGLQLSPHASRTACSRSSMCLEAETGAHTTKSDFFFFLLFFFLCLRIRTSGLTHHVKDVHKCSLLQESTRQKTVTFIQPYVSLQESLSRQLSFLSCFCHVAFSPRVKWLLFLHEHFSSSHRNKKP